MKTFTWRFFFGLVAVLCGVVLVYGLCYYTGLVLTKYWTSLYFILPRNALVLGDGFAKLGMSFYMTLFLTGVLFVLGCVVLVVIGTLITNKFNNKAVSS